VPLLLAGNLELAIRSAYEDARSSASQNPVVLLSPACASFDQFRDFEHRGDAFRELVGQLQGAERMQSSLERSI
jgi:UDP-N-acetylmuramoylalanine--D-glutamate ligase